MWDFKIFVLIRVKLKEWPVCNDVTWPPLLTSLHNHRNMALRSHCRQLAAQVARLKHCVNDCTRHVSGSGLSLARIKPLHEPAGEFVQSSRWHRRSWHLCVGEKRPSGFSSWTLAWGVMGELTCRLSCESKTLVAVFDTWRNVRDAVITAVRSAQCELCVMIKVF